MDTAAFFDLDRTLLVGASGPMFSATMREVGVLPDRTIPGEGLIYKVFDVIGETLPSMVATRQMARVAKGWDRSLVQDASKTTVSGSKDRPQSSRSTPMTVRSPSTCWGSATSIRLWTSVSSPDRGRGELGS